MKRRRLYSLAVFFRAEAQACTGSDSTIYLTRVFSTSTTRTHPPSLFKEHFKKHIKEAQPMLPFPLSIVRVSICNPLTNSPTSHMQIANHICTDNSANKQQRPSVLFQK
ncbi:hypothetical protein TgHK011_006171 [Trichoderma gracile]|nr:hypothetical protein TgHK011_006171 [Trichoderma gracile]